MGLVLVPAVAAVVYAGTVSFLAFTVTFARRGELRREARSTLALVVPGRAAEVSQQPSAQQ